MTATSKRRTIPLTILLFILGVALLASPGGPLAASAIVSNGAAAATGLGFWETLSCIGCIAGFVVGAGTTIAGLAMFLAANPEIGIMCVSTCVAAAT
jgi:hypothetical protein